MHVKDPIEYVDLIIHDDVLLHYVLLHYVLHPLLLHPLLHVQTLKFPLIHLYLQYVLTFFLRYLNSLQEILPIIVHLL